MKITLLLTIFLASALAVAAVEHKSLESIHSDIKKMYETKRAFVVRQYAAEKCKAPAPSVNTKGACACYYRTVHPEPHIDAWYVGGDFEIKSGSPFENDKVYHCAFIMGFGNITFGAHDQTDSVYLGLHANSESTCVLKDVQVGTGAKDKANKYIDCPRKKDK